MGPLTPHRTTKAAADGYNKRVKTASPVYTPPLRPQTTLKGANHITSQHYCPTNQYKVGINIEIDSSMLKLSLGDIFMVSNPIFFEIDCSSISISVEGKASASPSIAHVGITHLQPSPSNYVFAVVKRLFPIGKLLTGLFQLGESCTTRNQCDPKTTKPRFNTACALLDRKT